MPGGLSTTATGDVMARISRVAAYDRTVLKDIAKRLMRPVSRRVIARVDARVQPIRRDLEDVSGQVDSVSKHFGPVVARVQTHDRLTRTHEEAIGKLEEQVTSINRYLPGVLNSISSQNAAAREARRTENDLRDHLTVQRDELAHAHKRIDELSETLAEQIDHIQERTEFVRREILFETRYGSGSQHQERGFVADAEPKIVAPEKVSESGSDIRLNLGCGHLPIDGYLNVDGRELPGVDIVAEVGDLPFDAGTVAQIHSAHLLEHFPVEELSRRLLPYWFNLLRPGGKLTAVVPDAETMLKEYAANRLTFDELRLVTFGEQEYAGDFHFNMFSQSSLRDLLSATGFVNVKIIEEGRRNGVCYEMEIAAERPEPDV